MNDYWLSILHCASHQVGHGSGMRSSRGGTGMVWRLVLGVCVCMCVGAR